MSTTAAPETRYARSGDVYIALVVDRGAHTLKGVSDTWQLHAVA